MNQICIILICICACSLPSVELGTHDSLSLWLAGGALASYERTSGLKASESALLSLQFRHEFSEHTGSVIEVRASRNLPNFSIDQGFLFLKQDWFRIDAGFLTKRLGQSLYFRPHSLFNPFFNNPFIWYSTGFGVSARSTGKIFSAQTNATLNNRENGTISLTLHSSTPHLESSLLAGFHTCSMENQDNVVTTAMHVLSELTSFKAQAALKYELFNGYGNTTNPTMHPGSRYAYVTEAELGPFHTFDLDLLFAYEVVEKKQHTHQRFHSGADITSAFSKWIGLGTGIEIYGNTTLQTMKPVVKILILPQNDHANLTIEVGCTRTGKSSHFYSGTSELWVQF